MQQARAENKIKKKKKKKKAAVEETKMQDFFFLQHHCVQDSDKAHRPLTDAGYITY